MEEYHIMPSIRFNIQTTRHYDNGQLAILVYDKEIEQHFLYYENEVKSIPSELNELKRCIDHEWFNIKNGYYRVKEFSYDSAI
ncbi:hypothetical protein [Gracilibacillus lacisalsi]|uniref:hypothetical protein n=1 Tax=Gracilibacillus lacisalsi TaxID=393087 RepID=UPI00036E3C93|nr:hypothetical protein [Gracilibacillus lacisalsi]